MIKRTTLSAGKLTKSKVFTLFCQLFFSIVLCALTPNCSYASQTRKIVLIGIDGCRSDALQQANTPILDSLVTAGLYSYDSWHLGITISGPSWSTIMTGTWWNKHGVKNNSYSNSNFNSYPYFTKRAKEIKPNLKCVQVAEWEPLTNEVYNDGMDVKIITSNGGDSTTAESLRQLQDTGLDCLFAYYEAVDREGHATGFSPGNSNYISSIEYMDNQIGLLMQGLKTRMNYATENWLVLLVTDHGGTSVVHGGNSWAERHIWWIASGEAITPRQIAANDPGTYNFLATGIFNSVGVNKTLMKQSPVQSDIAVTALHHLIYDSGVHPESQTAWKLDGKSWLNNTIGIETRSEPMKTKVFPNPSNGLISVELDIGNQEPVSVEIWDALARQLKTVEFQKGTTFFNLDLSEYSNGFYLLVIKTTKNRVSHKIELIR